MINPRRSHVLDSGIVIYYVLADYHYVELSASERSVNAGKLANGTQISERLEQRAKGHVRALVAVADWRLDRALQDDLRALDGVDCLRRNSGFDSLRELRCACGSFLGFHPDPGRLDGLERRRAYFRPDSVARN